VFLGVGFGENDLDMTYVWIVFFYGSLNESLELELNLHVQAALIQSHITIPLR
jgi:hypothetical protein